jgi:hypothetical protein
VPASAYPPPEIGEIVYCRFPENLGRPGPKPRPALVISIGTFEDGTLAVRLAYGTSQDISDLHAGEFVILPTDGEAYRVSGLSFATKFDLRQLVDLPYTDEWFRVPPAPLFGETPKMGLLHPSLMHRAEAAFSATKPLR